MARERDLKEERFHCDAGARQKMIDSEKARMAMLRDEHRNAAIRTGLGYGDGVGLW